MQAGALAVKGATREKFAAAQYRDMDDAAKLSAPAYEPLDSGVELGAAGQPWATGPLAQRNVRYETIIIDTAFERVRHPLLQVLGRAVRPLPRRRGGLARRGLAGQRDSACSRSPARSR